VIKLIENKSPNQLLDMITELMEARKRGILCENMGFGMEVRFFIDKLFWNNAIKFVRAVKILLILEGKIKLWACSKSNLGRSFLQGFAGVFN